MAWGSLSSSSQPWSCATAPTPAAAVGLPRAFCRRSAHCRVRGLQPDRMHLLTPRDFEFDLPRRTHRPDAIGRAHRQPAAARRGWWAPRPRVHRPAFARPARRSRGLQRHPCDQVARGRDQALRRARRAAARAHHRRRHRAVPAAGESSAETRRPAATAGRCGSRGDRAGRPLLSPPPRRAVRGGLARRARRSAAAALHRAAGGAGRRGPVPDRLCAQRGAPSRRPRRDCTSTRRCSSGCGRRVSRSPG